MEIFYPNFNNRYESYDEYLNACKKHDNQWRDNRHEIIKELYLDPEDHFACIISRTKLWKSQDNFISSLKWFDHSDKHEDDFSPLQLLEWFNNFAFKLGLFIEPRDKSNLRIVQKSWNNKILVWTEDDYHFAYIYNTTV